MLMLVATVATARQSKKLHLMDSSYEAYMDANRALRSYGFKVIDVSNDKKQIMLERELMGTQYQTIITYQGKNGISVETYAFYKEKNAWTNHKTINAAFIGIERMVRYMIVNNTYIPHVSLSDTPFWSTRKIIAEPLKL